MTPSLFSSDALPEPNGDFASRVLCLQDLFRVREGIGSDHGLAPSTVDAEINFPHGHGVHLLFSQSSNQVFDQSREI